MPSWRATKDISIKDDLVEEVGRMVGYDSITPQAPLIAAAVPPENPARLFHARRAQHGGRQGFTEVYNYSFVSEEMVRAFGFDPAEHVRRDESHRVRSDADAGQLAARRSGRTLSKTAGS